MLLFLGQTASLTSEDKGEQKEADWISLGPRMLKWIRRLALGISVGGVGWPAEGGREREGAEKENEEVGNPQTTPFFLAEVGRSNRVTFFWEYEPRKARLALASARPRLSSLQLQVLEIYSVEFPPKVQYTPGQIFALQLSGCQGAL